MRYDWNVMKSLGSVDENAHFRSKWWKSKIWLDLWPWNDNDGEFLLAEPDKEIPLIPNHKWYMT